MKKSVNSIGSIFIFVVFLFVSPSYSDNYPPDFSDLAAALSPSVVNISTTLSAQPNAPGIPQFPPGSPFEDFFRDFFEKSTIARKPFYNHIFNSVCFLEM